VHNVHMYPSWLRRFRGQHPEQILRMKKDIETGLLNVSCRDNTDIEGLLSLPNYKLIRWVLERFLPIRLSKCFGTEYLLRRVLPITYDRTANRLGMG
jgi:hypothetical protein